MRFVGKESEGRTWWLMSKLCLENMLKRVGFRTVTQVGAYSGILRRVGVTYQREVLMGSG